MVEAILSVYCCCCCCCFTLGEHQQTIAKAKETIAAATAKCKDVEENMKVCVGS